MRIEKIAKATITAAATFALAVAPAFAATTGGTSVVNSGDHATVNSTTSSNSSVAVSNSNSAHVDQNVNAKAVTGGNTASGNITLGGGGTSIQTGPAGVTTNLGVDVNKNNTAVSGATGAAANLTDVVNTGDRAYVNTNTSNNNTVDVTNSNYAGVSQNAWEKAVTGGNRANDNIGGPTSINTGAAGISTGFGVNVNSNNTAVYGTGLGYGGPLNQTSVTNTGDRVGINSNASTSNAAFVNNYNKLWVAQDVHAVTDTGYNRANDNIGGPTVIGTGTAVVGTGASVNANSNWTGIAGGNGATYGVNAGDIVNTGDHLRSNTNVSDNTAVSVSNVNHTWSYQDVYTRSYSGENKSTDNIGGFTGIGTGTAGAGANLAFMGNNNSTAVGSWVGGLMGWLSM